MRYMTARFYGPTDPAPEVLPPFLVVVGNDEGAWACYTKEQALEVARQLRANRRQNRVLAVVK